MVFFLVFTFLNPFTALGAGMVFLKTTVPNTPKSYCSTVGSITMELDHETTIYEGDRIQFTLNNGTASCREIDFFLTILPGDSNSFPDYYPGTGFSSPVSTVNSNDKVSVTFPNGETYTPTEHDYGFRIQMSIGSQVIQMTAGRRNRITGQYLATQNPSSFVLSFDAAAGDISTDRLIIRLFDQKYQSPYFWKDNPALPGTQFTVNSNTEENSFSPENNSLDIDTVNFSWDFLEATPDSLPAIGSFPLSFSGDYRIARLILIPGDFNCNGEPDLGDAIIGLRILSAQYDSSFCFSDANGDDRVGIEEVIYILRTIN